jgi:hypothetical protein
MFVLLAGFIGLVGLASAFDLPRVRGIVEQMADTLSPGPSGQLLREAARQGAEGGTAAMVLGLLAALLAGTLAMAQVERYANRLAGRPEDRPFRKRYGVAFVLALSAGMLLAAGGLSLVGGRAVSEGLGLGGCGAHGLVRSALATGGRGCRCRHLPPVPNGAARTHRFSRSPRRGDGGGGRALVPVQPRSCSVLFGE